MELNRQAILTANDSGCKPVDVPEWGGRVFLRKWTGRQRQEFRAWTEQRKGDTLADAEISSHIVVMSVCDQEGKLLFSNGDEELLLAKSGSVLNRIATEALQHNGLAAEAVEEARQDFFGTEKNGSGSTSLAS